MKREQCRDILKRIVAEVCTGNLPIEIREIYVFGSFSRGAAVSHDLNLVIVHEPYNNEKQEKERMEAIKQCEWRKAWRISTRHLTSVRRILIKPCEKIQLLTGTNLSDACECLIFMHDMRLVWSTTAPNVEKNLSEIVVNSESEKLERKTFISPRRIGDHRVVVEGVTEMLERKELQLERISLEDFSIELNANYLHCLKLWNKHHKTARKAFRLFPYGLQWMQSQRAGGVHVDGSTLHNIDWTRRVQMGYLSLWEMRLYFGWFRQLKRQCLIPFRKRNELNELWVFERGPEWKKCDDAKIEPRKRPVDRKR